MKIISWIGLAAAAVMLVSCERADKAVAPAPGPATPAVERLGPVSWNAAIGAFMQDGRPLKTAKLWTFDGSTEGFTGVGSKVSPAPGQGLAVTVADPSLRSPRGLDIPGDQYSQVLIRITRTGAGEAWDGALYYTTPNHPESIDFLGKAKGGVKPGLNETVTLVYDMSRPAAGSGDWLTSTIDQLRIDIEDRPGGQFVIHQVAIAENPDAAPTPAAPPPPAKP